MLYSNGNDLIRVQCAFVDTPEVEKIVDYIGSQKAYASAYLLPELVGVSLIYWIFRPLTSCTMSKE